MPAGNSGASLECDISKLRSALEAVRSGPSIHEGLYSAFVRHLQWIESLEQYAGHRGSGLELIVELVTHPEPDRIDLEAREAIRSLTETEARQIVDRLEYLLSVLEEAADRSEDAEAHRAATRH